jgi:hypothetical protein
MERLTNTQTLFISSKNRNSGKTHDFSIEFPSRSVECEDDELLSITLLNFNMFASWYSVDENNNSFNIKRSSDQHTTTIELAHGNYPFKTLYQNINLIFGSNICNWDKVKNKLYFTFTDPHSISFNNKSYEVLGFNNETYTGTVIDGVYVLNPLLKMDTVCLNIYGE